MVDTLGILKACLALLPFMFAPGYVLGWALDLFEFRQRRPILRLILAVPLTIAICPMLSYLLARFFEPGLWAFYLVCSLLACCFWSRTSRCKLRRLAVSFKIYLGCSGPDGAVGSGGHWVDGRSANRGQALSANCRL